MPTLNLDGTINDDFRIGKKGPRIRQGVAVPIAGVNGDLYLQHGGSGAARLWHRRRGAWRQPTQVLSHDYSQIVVVNSGSNQRIVTESIVSNFLLEDNAIQQRSIGTVLNDTGIDQEVRLRLRYGSQNLISVLFDIPASAVEKSFYIEGELVANESPSAQKGSIRATFSERGVLAVPLTLYEFGTATTDSTVDATLRIDWRFANADANLQLIREYSHTEIIPSE